jgi:hypothetical protein
MEDVRFLVETATQAGAMIGEADSLARDAVHDATPRFGYAPMRDNLTLI